MLTRLPALLLLVLLLAPPAAGAQVITLTGEPEAELGPRLEALLSRHRYRLAPDTILRSGDTLQGTVLRPGGTYIVAGHIAGDLVGIQANLFLRPTATVSGDVVNAGGGLYASELAQIGGQKIDRPLAPYRAVPQGNGWRILADAPLGRLLGLRGVAGFRVPTYDRVNGLSLSWGPTLELQRGVRDTLRLDVWGSYFSQRGDFGGGAEVLYGNRERALVAGAERGWVTNERWIRSDLKNSLSSIWNGKDYRDYYSADRITAELRRGWLRENRRLHARAGVRLEDATSLRRGSPWSVLSSDSLRLNRPVDMGRIASVFADLNAEWVGEFSSLDANIGVEGAGEFLSGDHEFARFAVNGEFAMAALANHELEVELYTAGPLFTDALPLQRWSFVGGSGTIHTIRDAEFNGDRIAFLESKYIVPLNRFEIRYLGVPALQFIHAAGMAWTEDTEPDLEHEVGVRLQFPLFYLRYLINPNRDSKFNVNVSMPAGSRKWRGRR